MAASICGSNKAAKNPATANGGFCRHMYAFELSGFGKRATNALRFYVIQQTDQGDGQQWVHTCFPAS